MQKPFIFRYQRSLYSAWYNEMGVVDCILPMAKNGKKGTLCYRTTTETVMRRVVLHRDKWEILPEYELGYYELGYYMAVRGLFVHIIPMFYNKEEVSFKTFTHIKTPEQLPLLVSSMYMMESKSSKLVGVYILDVGELYFEESLYLGKSEKTMHWERFTSWNRAVRGYTLHLLEDCIVL